MYPAKNQMKHSILNDVYNNIYRSLSAEYSNKKRRAVTKKLMQQHKAAIRSGFPQVQS